MYSSQHIFSKSRASTRFLKKSIDPLVIPDLEFEFKSTLPKHADNKVRQYRGSWHKKLWKFILKIIHNSFQAIKKILLINSAKTANKNVLSSIENESIFIKLLEGVEQKWNREQVIHFIENNCESNQFYSWLSTWGNSLLSLTSADHELARRMVYLSELNCGKVSRLSLAIGRQLLAKESSEPTSGHNQIDVLLKKAEHKTYIGQYKAAKEFFHQALELDCENHEIWFRLGFISYILEEYEESVGFLNKALKLRESYAIAKAFRGWSYSKLNSNATAQIDFESVVGFHQNFEYESNDYQDWQARCIAIHGLKAINCLPISNEYLLLESCRKAVELNPNSCEVWLTAGIALTEFQEYGLSLEFYDKALKLKPSYSEVYRRRCIALSKYGYFESAVISASAAIFIQPDFYKAWTNMGICLSHLTLHKEAIKSYGYSLSINSNFAGTWYNRGNAFRFIRNNKNNKSNAVKSYQKAVKIKPNYPQAWYYLGRTQEKIKEKSNYTNALKSYEKAIEYQPDHFPSWCRKSHVLMILHENIKSIRSYDQAIKISLDLPSYDKAIKLGFDTSQIWDERNRVVTSLIESRHYIDVVKSCKRILKLDPNNIEEYLILANSLIQLNTQKSKFDDAYTAKEALGYYRKAIDLGCQDPAAFYGIGNILQAQNKYQEAYSKYKEALKRDSQCWQAYDGQAWISYRQKHKTAESKWLQGIKELKKGQFEGREEGLGELYYSLGRYWQIRRSWNKAKEYLRESINYLKIAKLLEREVEVWQNLLKVSVAAYVPESTRLRKELRETLVEGTERYEYLFKVRQKSSYRLSKKFASFHQLGVDAYINLENHDEALKNAELRKNYCLSWLYSKQQQKTLDSWNYQEIRETLLDDNTIAVDWHISPLSISTFILINDKPPIVNTIRNPTKYKEYIRWVKQWKDSYKNYRNNSDNQISRNGEYSWQFLMKERLDNLFNILEIKNIFISIEGTNIDRIILIPHRDLHLFPLHVFFNPPYAEKDFTVTYLPSAKSSLIFGATESQRDQSSKKSLVCVDNPSSQKKTLHSANNPSNVLVFAELEALIIGQLFPCLEEEKKDKRLKGKEASKGRVVKSLKISNDYFHFTGHAYHNLVDPRNSALALSGKDNLTMQEIFKEFSGDRLIDYQIVSLSACETGITGKSELIDEFVSLSSSFLAAGVSYVVSTLWKVNEIPSALLMIEFYKNVSQGIQPPDSLKEAQKWLSDLTVKELVILYRSFAKQLEENENYAKASQMEAFASSTENNNNSEARLYSNVESWGGFIITGAAHNK